jgi:hypothetical protein
VRRGLFAEAFSFAGILLDVATAVIDPLKSTRDATLDQAASAFEDYVQNELKKIDAEAQSLRNRKATGTATTLAKANAQASKLLVINDISTFLTG